MYSRWLNRWTDGPFQLMSGVLLGMITLGIMAGAGLQVACDQMDGQQLREVKMETWPRYDVDGHFMGCVVNGEDGNSPIHPRIYSECTCLMISGWWSIYYEMGCNGSSLPDDE